MHNFKALIKFLLLECGKSTGNMKQECINPGFKLTFYKLPGNIYFVFILEFFKSSVKFNEGRI